MKSILLLFSFFIILLGSSCQKDYHCGCTNIHSGDTKFYTIKAGSDAEASNECLLKADSVTDCTL